MVVFAAYAGYKAARAGYRKAKSGIRKARAVRKCRNVKGKAKKARCIARALRK